MRAPPRIRARLASLGRRGRRAVAGRPPDVVLTLGAALVLGPAALGVAGVRALSEPEGTIAAGTVVAGLPLGGLTAEEAARVLRARTRPPAGSVRLALPGGGRTLSVPTRALDPVPDVRGAIRRALDPPPVGARLLRELGVGRRRSVPLTYRLDPGAVRRLVRRVARLADRAPRSARVTIRRGRVVALPARAGRRVMRGELGRELRALPARLAVPVAPVAPAVDDAAARRAAGHAERIVDGGVVVVGGGRRASVGAETLLRALRFERRGGEIRLRISAAVLRRAIAPAFRRLVRPPRSARFRISGRRVRVVPARSGRRLDAVAMARAIISRSDPRTIRPRMRGVEPALTTGRARRMRIRALVGSFTTPFACCEPRVVNIALAARILDGTIIPAGARFSLNQALGERTPERGFVPAPQINAGRLEDAVGGGVSQVATTVFNAAFFAGLRIITHTPHEFWITRYPPGREATISWGGPELVVQNDWPAAVLLTARATDTSLTVSMYSDSLGRRVDTETVGVPVAGAPFSVIVTRRVWAGDRLRRDERFSWTYRAPPPPS